MMTRPLLRRFSESDNARGPRRRRGMALVGIGAVALGLAACGGSSSSSPPTTSQAQTTTTGGPTSTTSPATTSTTSIATCKTAALAISVGAPNGSAGATHYGLTFQNTGSTPCTMYGYPGVSFLDTGGHQIGAAAERQTGGPMPTVTLAAASGNAYASLAVTDPGIPPCSGSAAAVAVQVYPPGETHAAQVAAPAGLKVCTSQNTTAYRSSIVTAVSATQI